jgi:hypothetical protein
MSDIRTFIQHYIASLLFYGQEEDEKMMVDELAPETLEEISRECQDFLANNGDLVRQAEAFYGFEQIAHELYLTRNGHGCGFWDGDLPEVLGEKLTAIAKELGEQSPYYGDDGKIYV